MVGAAMIDLEDRVGGTALGGLASEMAGMFSESGRLASSPDFEFRPQQQEMAVRVAAALTEERPLIVEAGTGVGKSLAYLIPAIRFALSEKRKALVSTHTINLQEQLVQKDLPLAGRVTGQKFSYLLWKGRANYLCPQRLRHAMAQTKDLFSGDEEAELRAIWEWAQHSEDGSLSDLDFRPSARMGPGVQ
jgi:ATP-dependent DNA helicase DinG